MFTEIEIQPTLRVTMQDVVSTTISGMTCMSCVGKVEDALASLEGASNISVDLSSGKASMQGVTHDTMEDTIISLGYGIGNQGTGTEKSEFNWKDRGVWKQSAHNTKWCLIGCSIGDLGTIAYFQFIWTDSGWSTMAIMMLAIMNGLLTSIALETIILLKQLPFKDSLRTAMGMSFISMIAMEAAMNLTDVVLTGGAMLTPYAILPMLIAGFLTPWPYNYWRLKKYGFSCH